MKQDEENRMALFDVVHRIAHGEAYRQVTPVIETTNELAERLTDLETDDEVETLRYEVDELNDRMDEVGTTIENEMEYVKENILSEMAESASDINDALMARVVELEKQLHDIVEWAQNLNISFE